AQEPEGSRDGEPERFDHAARLEVGVDRIVVDAELRLVEVTRIVWHSRGLLSWPGGGGHGQRNGRHGRRGGRWRRTERRDLAAVRDHVAAVVAQAEVDELRVG